MGVEPSSATYSVSTPTIAGLRSSNTKPNGLPRRIVSPGSMAAVWPVVVGSPVPIVNTSTRLFPFLVDVELATDDLHPCACCQEPR